MKKLLLCLLVVILCGMSSSALADGNKLLKQCKAAERYMNEGQFKKDEDQIKVAFCMGIVEGVGSTMALLSSREDALDHKYRVCFPESGITNRQAVRVVVNFLVNHPKDLHKNEVALLMAAFWDAYPCKYA